MHPSVSVILPVFNCQEHLDEAIQSVLQQDVPLELIIVDDGSTDGSSQIAQSYQKLSEHSQGDQFAESHDDQLAESHDDQLAESHDDQFAESHDDQITQLHGKLIRYIRQENKGVAAARNAGVGAANCELLAFIDADDLWTHGKLQKQVEALSVRPEVACVMGKIQMFVDRVDCDEKSKAICGEPYYSYVLGSAVIRRSAFESVGNMDESMKITSDMEWFVRLREQFRVEPMDFVSLLYRYRPGSLTSGKGLKERNILSLIKQSLDRRRSANGEARPLC
jgi:Glycosyltransferases involved in cell wall biogenesis